MKRLSVVLLALVILTMSAVPAFAVTEGSTNVTIQTKATTIDVTVPTDLPIVFNADGTNTVPTDFTIKNNSAIAGLHVAKIELTKANNSDWQIMHTNGDTKTLAANTKQIQFFIGLEGALKQVVPEGDAAPADSGSYSFGASDITLNAGESKILRMDVKRGAFTEASAQSSAFTMAMTFAFN